MILLLRMMGTGFEWTGCEQKHIGCEMKQLFIDVLALAMAHI